MQEVTRQCRSMQLTYCSKKKFYQLHPDLQHFPKKSFGMYMSVETFAELLKTVSPKITKKWMYLGEPISLGQELVLTLI